MSLPLQEPFVPWWGDYDLAPGQAGAWHIGPLDLWIEHLAREWRLRWQLGDDPHESNLRIRVPADDPPSPDAARPVTVARYAAPPEVDRLSFSPRLADRAMVLRPEEPFLIPAGVTANFFANTSLWLELQVGSPGRALCELPMGRPPSTWFGTSKAVGELCYASRTRMRTSYDELPHRPHRAATQITIINNARAPLTIERMRLPVEHLSLYRSDDGYLITEPVTLERSDHEDASFVVSHVGAGPRARRVAPPRRSLATSGVVRALSSFSQGGGLDAEEPGSRA